MDGTERDYGSTKQLRNMFTLDEFRESCSELIKRKGVAVSVAAEKAGFGKSTGPYYRAVNPKFSKHFAGLKMLIAMLDIVGYHCEFYIQVKDRAPGTIRRTPNLNIVDFRKQARRTRRKLEEE